MRIEAIYALWIYAACAWIVGFQGGLTLVGYPNVRACIIEPDTCTLIAYRVWIYPGQTGNSTPCYDTTTPPPTSSSATSSHQTSPHTTINAYQGIISPGCNLIRDCVRNARVRLPCTCAYLAVCVCPQTFVSSCVRTAFCIHARTHARLMSVRTHTHTSAF